MKWAFSHAEQLVYKSKCEIYVCARILCVLKLSNGGKKLKYRNGMHS